MATKKKKSAKKSTKENTMETPMGSEILDGAEESPAEPIPPCDPDPIEDVQEDSHAEREGISGDAPAAPQTAQIESGLPPLGPKEKYFEAPDGRVFVGPHDASSIPDPRTGHEINPMRGASLRLHR